MKRAALILASLAVLGTVGTVMFEGKLFAAPPESEELVFPAMSPTIITADEPTFITFTATLTDPDIRRPKLQVFNPTKGKWETIAPLKDNGKDEDQVKDDQVFTKRLWFLDTDGVTQIGFEKRNGEIKVKRTVPSPAQIRLVAKRKRVRGILVSQGLSFPRGASVGGVQVGVPTSWQVETYPRENGEAPVGIFTSPSGSVVVLLPEGGFAHGVDLDGFVDQLPITVAGFPATRANFRDDNGGFLYSQVAFDPPLPSLPAFRLEFRPAADGGSAGESFDQMLQSIRLP